MRRILLQCAAAAAIASCSPAESQQDRPDRETRREAERLGLQPQQVDQAALRAQAGEGDAKRFYELRDWQAGWDEDRAAELLEALAGAEAHALSRSMFLELPLGTTATDKELALTRAALDYASALARGRLDPAELFPIYSLPRPNPDIAQGLSSALAEGKVGQWLESLAPRDPEYRALSEAYLRYLGEAARESEAIAGGKAIKAGMRDPRVPRIAEALRSNGYLGPGEAPEPNLYTTQIADAVTRAQADHGIEADGIVGPATLEVLNTSAVDRARQLAVNLERRRWLVREAAPTRIDVNIAATMLEYWRVGELRDRRRVVVGQPDWETPQLASPIFRLVANPTWTVPRSIEEEEIRPKGAGYMARNNMVWRDGWIVQLPGTDNALGEVKFDMRNDHAIYLHDTPAKALFAESERHRSHGCVRVEDALGFARMLARDNGILEGFQRAIATREETFVKLPSEIPVRLLYHSAFMEQGALRLRTDAYGWDEKVAVALGMSERPSHKPRSHVGDIGP